ncbi:putative coatomer gamma subunit protein [Helianthus debilis subsp. tardiflorus]
MFYNTGHHHGYQLNKGLIRESSMNNQSGDRSFFDYLEGCLRHKEEMLYLKPQSRDVIFEAARAITELKGVTNIKIPMSNMLVR